MNENEIRYRTINEVVELIGKIMKNKQPTYTMGVLMSLRNELVEKMNECVVGGGDIQL